MTEYLDEPVINYNVINYQQFVFFNHLIDVIFRNVGILRFSLTISDVTSHQTFDNTEKDS